MKNAGIALITIALYGTLSGCDKKAEDEKKANTFLQPYTGTIPKVDAERIKPLNWRQQGERK